MLDRHGEHDPLSTLSPVCDADAVRSLIAAAKAVYAADVVKEYVIALIRATRQTPELRLGASPRAALHLLRAAKAHALLEGRNHVLPDDVQDLLIPVLAHRVLPSADATVGRRAPEDVLATILSQVPLPRPRSGA